MVYKPRPDTGAGGESLGRERASSGLDQGFQEPGMERAPSIARPAAQELEHGPCHGEGEHPRFEMLTHGLIGRSDDGLGRLQIFEQRKELAAAGAKRSDHRRGIRRLAVVRGSSAKRRQLIWIDVESHRAEIVILVRAQRTDQQMIMSWSVVPDHIQP